MAPEDDRDGASTGSGIGDPAALGVASLLMGGLSLGGFGLLNGSRYVLPLGQGRPVTNLVLISGLVGALIAAVAVALGALARRRADQSHPTWVPRIAAAGILVSAIALLLRLVATWLAAVQIDGYGFLPPL